MSCGEKSSTSLFVATARSPSSTETLNPNHTDVWTCRVASKTHAFEEYLYTNTRFTTGAPTAKRSPFTLMDSPKLALAYDISCKKLP